jgi:hypothetical protein
MRTGSVALEKQGFTIQRGDTSECVYRKIGDAAEVRTRAARVWDHVDEMIFVASPGLDGRQTVVGIWRQQNWKPGEMPSRAAVLKALRDKYGRKANSPTSSTARSAGVTTRRACRCRASDPTFRSATASPPAPVARSSGKKAAASRSRPTSCRRATTPNSCSRCTWAWSTRRTCCATATRCRPSSTASTPSVDQAVERRTARPARRRSCEPPSLLYRSPSSSAPESR